jgi:hypothetical protein
VEGIKGFVSRNTLITLLIVLASLLLAVLLFVAGAIWRGRTRSGTGDIRGENSFAAQRTGSGGVRPIPDVLSATLTLGLLQRCPALAKWGILYDRALLCATSHQQSHPCSYWRCSCKRELDGTDCFTFEEFGVGSEAEGFQQLGLHLF